MAKKLNYWTKGLVALFVALSALAFMGCPMEDDSSDGGLGLDSRLKGTWEFDDAGQGGERYVIDGTSFAYGSLSGTGADAVFTKNWAGTIVHAERYTNSAGIIIIEYAKESKQEWSAWTDQGNNNWVSTPIDPQPAGDFYGIYYHSLKTRDDGELEVKFANTSDMANNYGPTEAETLEAAIEKFTIENMTKFMDIDAGEPVHKVK
ncbi:MAG: hypothetical protein LBP80_07150 [Treponema sp.]|nr:hypothetical protein [Treponema sp.]